MISFILIAVIWLCFAAYSYNMGNKLENHIMKNDREIQLQYYYAVKNKFSVAVILTVVVLFVSIPLIYR